MMVKNLLSRSLATRIYVSACSRSSTPFEERDIKKLEIYNEFADIDGDTQEMLKYVQSVKHDVCLVSLDFSGLSSRSHHVKDLLEKNPSIKKIAMETFAVSNEVFIYDSDKLLSDVKLLEQFDCRPKPVQRSK
ncbi:hypothetical protein CLU79DRAFT_771648 [Phycomyces nitens]|nr:hypothetical protein CLU79DRAFT_771648 [Phycomyces nitens]